MLNLRECLVRVSLAATLAATSIGVVNAEVGVSTESGQVAVVYKLKITDDPDPVTGVWIRFHAENASRKVLNDAGFANGDGPPSFVHNRVSNQAVVAWARNSPSGYDVVVSAFAQNAWSPPTVVASSPDNELDPVLAVNPAVGTVHLFYWVNDASPRVMYTQAPADLSSWAPAVQVSSVGEVACRPATVLHDGSLRVVYESHGQVLGSIPRQLVMATKTGSSFVSETVATTHYAGSNWPEIHGRDDVLWVEWIDADDEMAWTSRPTTGTWGLVEIEPFTSIEMRDFHVRGNIRGLALE